MSYRGKLIAKAKSLGFSDGQIAALVGSTKDEVWALRKKVGLVPSDRQVDTWAARSGTLPAH